MKAGKPKGGAGVANFMQPSSQPGSFPLPYSGSGPMSPQQQQLIQSTIGRPMGGGQPFGAPQPSPAQPAGQLQSALLNSMSGMRPPQMPGSPQPGGLAGGFGGIGQMPGGPPQVPSPMSMPPNSFPPNGPMVPPQMQPPQGLPQPGLAQGGGAPQGMFRPQLGGLLGGRYEQR